jgi:hypothetical protein
VKEPIQAMTWRDEVTVLAAQRGHFLSVQVPSLSSPVRVLTIRKGVECLLPTPQPTGTIPVRAVHQEGISGIPSREDHG